MTRSWVLITTLTGVLWMATSSAQPAGGPPERLGQVTFPVSCRVEVQKPFERAVALLHSFWYLEAHNAFTAVTQTDPDCAMGYWGIAMSQWTQLWAPPSAAALQRGWEAVTRAEAAHAQMPRERAYIAAAHVFFKEADTRHHRTRALAYREAMVQLSRHYPEDHEATLFYALALQATADPHDKTYADQQQSAALVEPIFASEPDHPGAAHYLILAYDYPALASRGLPAARRYAQFAPSVPHALHMPSHIYVLLGMWPETIQSNLAAAAAEQRRGNPDDRMHALDYLLYGYLQQAQDAKAERLLAEARHLMAELAARHYDSGRPTAHFAMAAMEARWTLERGRWSEAAAIEPRSNRFPHTAALISFARAIGAARSGQAAQARADADTLTSLRDTLTQAQDSYWAEQVEIQRRAATAWVAHGEGANDEALRLMRAAAELEDSTEKHNITPGPIASARELLGDLLLELGQPAPAVDAYELSLQRAPNRFRALYGLATAAARAGVRAKARASYAKVVALAAQPDSQRPELQEAQAFLAAS